MPDNSHSDTPAAEQALCDYKSRGSSGSTSYNTTVPHSQAPQPPQPPRPGVAAVHVAPHYVAAITHKSSFPLNNMSYSRFNVVGVDDDSFEEDYNTSGESFGDT
ncbi:hypothetical protein AAF712_016228, partial [Marasmius tenuissimus]